ncbi:MAG: GTP-binding protein, partial [Gammaproteobacteria bacterium]|nr:GTP-binding protein [Gammaproteobacteria bacterium]
SNPIAKIYHTSNSDIDLEKVIGVGAFELEAKLEVDPNFLDDLEHEHDQSVGSFVLREERPIDMNRFMIWLNEKLAEQGEDMYRTKGIFNAQGFNERVIFQSVRMLTTMVPERMWKSGEEKITEYVMIGKNLDRDEFAEGFASCVVPGS